MHSARNFFAHFGHHTSPELRRPPRLVLIMRALVLVGVIITLTRLARGVAVVPLAARRFRALFVLDARDETKYARRGAMVRMPAGVVELAMANLIACVAGFLALGRRALLERAAPSLHDVWFLGHLIVTDHMIYEYQLNGRVFRGALWVGALVHLVAEARLASVSWETIAAFVIAVQQLIPIDATNLVFACASAFDVLVMGYFWEHATRTYWWAHCYHGIGSTIGELLLFVPHTQRPGLGLYVLFELALLATTVNVVAFVYGDTFPIVALQFFLAFVIVRAYRARFATDGHATKYEWLCANRPDVAVWQPLE